MSERERRDTGDITGATSGDFTDWNNPEDNWEDEAAEDYYDEDDDSYVPGPDDADYDLSEAAGYSEWDPPQRRSLLPQWLITAVALLLILALLTPLLIRIS